MAGGAASTQGGSSPGHCSENCLSWILISLALLLPNAVYLFLCTDITEWGTWLVLQVHSKDQSVHGDIALCGAALLVVVCYVLDWAHRHCCLKVLSGGFIWFLFVLGSALKERKYPSAIRVSILLHVPLLVALIRLRWDKNTRRDSRHGFYFTVGWVSLMFASLWFLIFVLYLEPVSEGLPVISDSHYWETTRYHMMMKLTDMYKYVLEDAQLSPYDCLHDDPQFVSINNSAELEGGQNISGELKLKVLAACKQADLVLVFLWVSPLIASFGFILLCFICMAILAHVDARRGELLATKEVVTPLVMGITLCVGGMYVSTYATGVTVNLSNGLIALGFWGFSALAIWSPFELSTDEIKNLKQLCVANFQGGGPPVGDASVGSPDPLPSKFREMLDNEWVQAMLTGCGLMPTLIALEWARNWCKSRTETPTSQHDNEDQESLLAAEGAFNDIMGSFVEFCKQWNWASVLVKVCILGYVYFTLQVGGTKASYVFLAGMNEYLSSQAYVYSLLIVFLIGLTMFLLPPVPGVPVYVFCGIVLGKERDDTPFGFWGSCAVAVVMGLVLKLLACTGQYSLGWFAGRDPRIQKFVGVDTHNVKAIESILKGNDVLGKIVIFVGGPDWPTSVMSGILKVDLPRMLLLTVPVVLVMAPCVLAGAYMSKVKPTTRNADSMLADGLMGAAAVGQLGSMVLATYFIAKAVTSGGAQLTTERDEHKEVKELRDAEKAYNDKYEDELFKVFDSNAGTRDNRWWLIVAAAALNVLSNLVFTSDLAFENFAVSGKISDPLDEFGLGNNPFNIVRPAGCAALALFVISIFLHVVFSHLVKRQVLPTRTV